MTPKGDGFVLTTVEDRGARKEYKIRSRHVVACDGAKSAVRKFLGVTSEGEETCECCELGVVTIN